MFNRKSYTNCHTSREQYKSFSVIMYWTKNCSTNDFEIGQTQWFNGYTECPIFNDQQFGQNMVFCVMEQILTHFRGSMKINYVFKFK